MDATERKSTDVTNKMNATGSMSGNLAKIMDATERKSTDVANKMNVTGSMSGN